GVGAILSQEGHPITYFSRKLNSGIQRQSTYIREVYVITEAVAKFRHYLLGHKFKIRIDQKILRSLINQTLESPEQQKWFHKLLRYYHRMRKREKITWLQIPFLDPFIWQHPSLNYTSFPHSKKHCLQIPR
ncbi:hypothetical protein V8G54_037381, partial [Vigna mungo]